MAQVLVTTTRYGKQLNKVAELNHSNQIIVSIWVEAVPAGANVAESFLEFETSGSQTSSWYRIQSDTLVPA